MRVALVHDYLKEWGGAEAVLSVLHEMFPEAPIYTAYAFPKYWGRHETEMGKWKIKQSWGRYLPFLPKLLSHYSIVSPLYFSGMDLTDFDLVIISQTGGYFPNGVKVGPKTKILTYCHTTPRFLYGYETATQERYKWYWRPISEVANHILRMVDFTFAQKPDLFVANSKNVAARIAKFYRRKAEVVYPPSITDEVIKKGHKRQDHFLIVSRIVGTKNIELAVQTANKYGFKLKVAGRPIGKSGQQVIEGISGKTVEYLGEVDDTEKARLLGEAKAVLALEKESDFGITAVEPQAYGTPVIAYRNGGYLEAVKENVSGVFFDELTPEGLMAGIEKFNKMKWNEEVVKKNADRFSKANFKRGLYKLIDKLMTENEKD